MGSLKWMALTALMSVTLTACVTTGGSTPQQQREAILTMEKEVLQELYQAKPDVRKQVASAPGYAVFSNANVNIILASFGGGRGVVTRAGGKKTFMKMGEVGVGLGFGVKDFRAVFVFHDQSTLDDFINHGWAFGGQADAAAKAGDKGAAAAVEAIVDNVTIYQLTESGLALQATLKGTKYWLDDDLN